MAALKILAWDLLSPWGDKSSLQSAWADGSAANQHWAEKAPDACARLVPDFEVRQQLGMKGTRSFDRHTGLFVKAATNALSGSGIAAEDLRSAAIINGTAAGSLASILDFLLDTWRNDQPYFVNPAHMPNTVLNCAASQLAIWCGVKGPNATVSAGSQSFFAALRMAGRWARQGYARHFVVGAVEEITPVTREMIEAYRTSSGYQAVFAEGGAAFACEAIDGDAVGPDADVILATRTATSSGTDDDALKRVVDAVLEAGQVSRKDVCEIVTKSPEWAASAPIETRAAGEFDARCSNVYDIFGHGYSVSGAMQNAMLLLQTPPGRIGLAISASGNGSVAATLIRKGIPA